jgi:hypothetical protein
MKKQFVILVLAVFLLAFAPLVSAGFSDKIKFVDEGKYGRYEINDTTFWIFNNKPMKTIELIENDYSILTAWNVKQIEIFKPSKLFDETNYFDITQKNDKSYVINSERQLYRKLENKTKIVSNIYCENYGIINTANGTREECSNWINNSYEEIYEDWSDWQVYDFRTMSIGTYQTKTIVTRNNQRTGVVEWIDENEGYDLTEWATWWNSSWGYYKEYTNLTGNITYALINASVNDNSDFNDTRFVTCDDTKELNHTLEAKFGTYGQFRINNLGENCTKRYYGNVNVTSTSNASKVYLNPVSGYYFDSDAKDFTKKNNGTVTGSTISGGYINNSYLFTSGDRIGLGTGIDVDGEFSASMWFLTNFTGFRYLWSKDGGSGNFDVQVYISAGSITYFHKDGSSATYATNYTDFNWHNIVVLSLANGTTQLYYDGVLRDSGTTGTADTSVEIVIGGRAGSGEYTGKIDEVLFYDRALTQNEITQQYTQTAPNFIESAEFQEVGVSTALISPNNGQNILNNTVNFNFTSTPSIGTNITNATLYIWWNNGTLVRTNFTTLSGDLPVVTNFINYLEDGMYKWNAETCGVGVSCSFGASNNSFIVHVTPINITISSPTGLFDYLYGGKNMTLNWSLQEEGENLSAHLSNCSYTYNGIVKYLPISTCINVNTTYFNYVIGQDTLTFNATDIFNLESNSSTSWTYKVLENNRTFNTTSYQTQNETFSINLTANSSLTAVKLNYGGTEYLTTRVGDIYLKTLDIPEANLGNNTISWNFTYAGDTIKSRDSYQNISETVFTLCNSSYTDDFLNFSFKDEDDLSEINASITTSTFTYYLGSGTETKLYTYQNNTDNYNYTFCATPDLTLNVDSYVQYKQGTDYPQRIYDPDEIQYNSTVTNAVLYLLGSTDGLYVTFQIINSAEQGISDVEVSGTRIISGETVEVANGLTDASGSVTFWLNPDFQHIFNFTKTGYDSATYIITPTQSTYTITLGGEAQQETDCTRGVSYSIVPSNNFLDQDTEYDFSFIMSSNYWALNNFSASLYYGDDTLINSIVSTTQEGGTIEFNNINTTNQTSMYMQYYYAVNNSICVSTLTNWVVQSIDGRDYSIWNLFQQADTYIEADLYGVKGDSGNSDFGRIVIAFLIIILVAGVTIREYGIQSETALITILFGLIAMLDFGLGFLPRIQIGGLNAVPSIITIVAFIMWLIYLIRER